MRHHTDLLLNILLIEDSWQHHRIHNALMGRFQAQYCDRESKHFRQTGVSEDREGLLDTIQRNRLNYQKRAYQCIKCLVQLFRKSPLAHSMLQGNQGISRPWARAVEWLHDELDRQRGVASQYNYSSWSPPAQSNENTNSFILERSQSAKNILQMAFELCPEEVSPSVDNRFDFSDEHLHKEQEEPNDSEVEPSDDFPSGSKKGSANESMSSPELQAATTADEEAVNKVAEKIDTLRMGSRQVRLGPVTVPSNLVIVYPSTGTRDGRVRELAGHRDAR